MFLQKCFTNHDILYANLQPNFELQVKGNTKKWKTLVSAISDKFCTDLYLEKWSAHTSTSVQVRSEEFRWPASHREAPRHHWDEIIFMTLSSYKKRVLAHFENSLDFKATHELTLIWSQPWFKKTVLTHFQNNLDFKAIWIFHNVSLVNFE